MSKDNIWFIKTVAIVFTLSLSLSAVISYGIIHIVHQYVNSL